MNILLVEDDIQLNKAVFTFLKLQKYNVTTLTDGNEAINSIDKNNYDMYILDINIPNINGLDIVKYIRKKDINTPIIMITASLEVSSFVNAYDFGCSEYIKKPFHLKELEIRINNLLNLHTNEIIELSDRIVYKNKYEELFIDDLIIKLRKKEKRLLSILIKNINHTVKSEDIIDYVWENEIKDKYPLRQLLSDLRNKLPKDFEYIKTEVGIGYRLENKT